MSREMGLVRFYAVPALLAVPPTVITLAMLNYEKWTGPELAQLAIADLLSLSFFFLSLAIREQVLEAKKNKSA